jgi:hypothetical protein
MSTARLPPSPTPPSAEAAHPADERAMPFRVCVCRFGWAYRDADGRRAAGA